MRAKGLNDATAFFRTIRYLRKILIHGARAAVLRIKRDRAPIGAWLDALDSRAPKNVVVVARPTSLHALHGLSCPAATTTGQQLFPHNGAEKTPLASKRCALPLSRTTTTTKVSHRSLHRSSKDERTVTTACPQPGPENGFQRPTDFEGRTRAHLILASPPKGRIHLRRLVFSTKLFPCSPAADHTFSGSPGDFPVVPTVAGNSLRLSSFSCH